MLKMSNANSTSHLERTASQPRHAALHDATISYIRPINSRIRLIRLALPYAISFLPGQWLDLHIPSLPDHTGGFTITTPPSSASILPQSGANFDADGNTCLSKKLPYLELAIQESPSNPPAAWLWRPEKEVLGQPVSVRVGGSFVWPPWKAKGGERMTEVGVKRAVFLAGGVGINPLISILAHLSEPAQASTLPETVRLLYSTRLASNQDGLNDILFFPRLQRIFEAWNPRKKEPRPNSPEKRPLVSSSIPSMAPDPTAAGDQDDVPDLHDDVNLDIAPESKDMSDFKNVPKSADPFHSNDPPEQYSSPQDHEPTVQPNQSKSHTSRTDSAANNFPPSYRGPLYSPSRHLDLHITPTHSLSPLSVWHASPGVTVRKGQITLQELEDALGPPEERVGTVAYVCGPQTMTDEMVGLFEGMGMGGRVLCERWW